MTGNAGARAIVGFADDTSLRILRLLPRGFRHCFVAVEQAGGWLVCEPMSHRTDLWFAEHNVGAMWRHMPGLTVVETTVREVPKLE